MDCKHENFGYFPAAPNEEGWKCFDCQSLMPGDPDGYRPDLDRSHIEDKVYGLINDLHQQNFMYVSNGTSGDGLMCAVAERCRETGFYDQISIIKFILEIGEDSHAEFWKEIGDGIMSGNDPRDRCHCGKLATSFSVGEKYCSEHSGPLFGGEEAGREK